MIYFIRDGEFIKIGLSVDPWRRLATFQTSHHSELELLAVMPGSADLESGLHRAFSSYATRGEWFSQNPKLLAFIESVKEVFADIQQQVSAEDDAFIEAPGDITDNAGVNSPLANDPKGSIPLMGVGDSTTFKLTHKGSFRNPPRDADDLWFRLSFWVGGYWRSSENETWRVMDAPGFRFDFLDMRRIVITRTDEVQPSPPQFPVSIRYALESALNDALKNAIFNRKNTASWLGVYNDPERGIMILVRRIPGEEPLQLDVPDEVLEHWRRYKHPSPLPPGVTIEG